MGQPGTKEQILKIAHNYLQRLGFSALSFQMIADDMGIKKPSLFHHFASKEELGLVIIEQYSKWFVNWTEKVSTDEPIKKLKKYFLIFEEFAKDDSKLCPIGALSMDINSIPPAMKKSIRELCDQHHDWLKKVLKEGIKGGDFKSQVDLGTLTNLVMSTLQGALMLSRVQDPKIFTTVRKNLEKLLGGEHAH